MYSSSPETVILNNNIEEDVHYSNWLIKIQLCWLYCILIKFLKVITTSG